MKDLGGFPDSPMPKLQERSSEEGTLQGVGWEKHSEQKTQLGGRPWAGGGMEQHK